MHLYQKIGVFIATFIWGMMGVWCFHSYQQWLLSSSNYQPETQFEKLTDVAFAPLNLEYFNINNSNPDDNKLLQYGYLRSKSFTPMECLGCNCQIIFYQYRDGRRVRFEEDRSDGPLKQRFQQYLRNASIIEKNTFLITNAPESQKITRILFTAANIEGDQSYLIAYSHDSDLQLITAPTLQLALEFEQAYQRVIADNF